MADGVGGGSIRSVDGAESFHEYAKLMESGYTEAFAAVWIKMSGVAPFTDRQVKLMRMGPQDDHGSGQKLYYHAPKFGFSSHPGASSFVGGLQANFWEADGTERASYHYLGDGASYDADYSVWTCVETYMRFNTIGLSNGVQQIETNGRLVCDKNDRYGRTANDQFLDYFMPFPGIANNEGTGPTTTLISRPYCDVGPTCRARIWLGDAPTAAACTKKFIVPATAWAADGISGTAQNLPSWALYAYVTNKNGVTSVTGTAVTDGSSASGTIKVTGSNYLTKATPKQFFFQPFMGLATGATPAEAGFDSWIDRGGESVIADGVAGGKSVCVDLSKTNNAQPHIGKYLPAGNQYVRLAFWLKVIGVSTGGGRQIKIARCGMRTGGLPNDDYASVLAKFFPQIFIYAGSVIGTNSVHANCRSAVDDDILGYFDPTSTGFGQIGMSEAAQPEIDAKNWVHVEVYLALGDLNSSNGVMQVYTNNFRQINLTQLPMKTRADEELSYMQPIPNMEASPDLKFAMGRMSIDVGPDCLAKVELVNGATSAGMTAGPIELEIESWANNEVVALRPAVIPAGYNWIKVTNRLGVSQTTTLPPA
jgi:hypothetical protein